MRRVATRIAVGVALLALLAGIGRWERARWLDSQRAGIASVLRTIDGRFLHSSLSDLYDDREGRVSCLRYAAGNDPYAMQVCFDPRGRLVETYDERSGRVVISDLHVEPKATGLGIEIARLKEIRGYIVTTQAEIAHAKRVANAKRLREGRS